MARSAVHAIAEPIVRQAPRALATVATAPVRVAMHRPEILRGEVLAYMVPRPQDPPPPSSDGVGQDDSDYDQKLVPAPDPDEPDDADDLDDPELEPERIIHRVAGGRAVLRNGIAYPPARAPQRVKNAISAVNALRRKPYIWGGGHGSFFDHGYDCSGTVSFALHSAGLIGTPLQSSELMRYGKRGRGHWFTIYARPGHTFAVIAGLRLDTTDFRNGGTTGPRWHAEPRDTRGYVARHPAGM